jgi:hypothetical protein
MRFFFIFLNLWAFLAYSTPSINSATYVEKVNRCINTTKNSSIREICLRYKLNFNEYKKIFPDKYFKNLSVPNFILLTTPKMGTHLVQKTIALMLGKAPLWGYQTQVDLNTWIKQLAENINEYPFSHLARRENYSFCIENNFKVITIKRDLRDQLVSSIFAQDKIDKSKGKYVDLPFGEKLKQKIFNCFNNSVYFLGCTSTEEIRRINSLGLLVKFENLVGPKGNGSLNLQKLEIKKIASYLNIALNERQITYICENLWGNTLSFRNGKIGDWRNYFTKEIKEEFIRKGGGDILIYDGYEEGYDW